MFLGLTEKEKALLEFVEFPNDLKVNLTRLLRAASSIATTRDQYIVHQNAIVSIAHNVLNLSQYDLVAEDGEYYYPCEFGWHNSQIEQIFHRGETFQSVEILADLISEEFLKAETVNTLLARYHINIEFCFYSAADIKVSILDHTELIDEHDDDTENQTSNMSILVQRMDLAVENNDPSSALHQCASAFETLSKEVLNNPNCENQTFGALIGRYRKDSRLSDEIVTYMHNIYKKRNTEPLAGHGATQEPSVTLSDAITFVEFTKAIIKIERKLQRPTLMDKSNLARR